MASRYPLPTDTPVYVESTDERPRRRFRLYPLFDALFIIIAIACALWLAGALLVEGISSWSLDRLALLVVFWALLAYLALPRIHQAFTTLYVPDYFIGRTRTGDGLLGDPVNLALDGSEEDIHAAMQRAGWTLADEITLRSTWRIIASTVLRRSYTEAPVSDLHLFDRRQQFAYQQEVDGNASKRHHVRFWPVPRGWVLPGGHRVEWLAAGTYDRSVGFSAFTGQFTHKIDANTDLERDYIVNSVRFADPEVPVEVISDFSSAYHDRNGGGDAIHTDGDLPVLDLHGARSRYGREPVLPASRLERNDHHVPPVGLLLTGLLVIAQLVAAVITSVAVVQSAGELGLDADESAILVTGLVGFGAVYVVLWGLTLARRRWARLGLMLLLTIDTATGLSEVNLDRIEGWIQFAFAAFNVLALLAVSGDSSRLWVAERRGGRPTTPAQVEPVLDEDAPADSGTAGTAPGEDARTDAASDARTPPRETHTL